MRVRFKNTALDHIVIGGKNPLFGGIAPDDCLQVFIHFEHPLSSEKTLCGIQFSEEYNGKLNTLEAVNCPSCKCIFQAVNKSKVKNPNSKK